jgi:magnesium chelatase family protein
VPIALGFLLASNQIKVISNLDKSWFVGELGLDGTIRPVRGILPIALAAVRNGIETLYIPAGNSEEASPLADQIAIYPVASLSDLIQHLSEEVSSVVLRPLVYQPSQFIPDKADTDFQDIRGQEHAKRALAIAAAGGHNVLLVGPPGTGKTLLARALLGILPPLRREESYTVTSLYSIAGLLRPEAGLMRQRPFRSPHHGASSTALVGGGAIPKPGEISLAHHGVLFLDELPEFSRHTLEQLRQPLEEGMVTVARAAHTLRFPARAVLVAAMNPCPCGFLGSDQRECTCTPSDIIRYQKRISGPLLDRFDLHVLVSDIPTKDLLQTQSEAVASSVMAEAVQAARQQAWERQNKTNAELLPKEIEHYCHIDGASKDMMLRASERFRLSARGIHRLLKVALTIADLDQAPALTPTHLAEALQYREQLSGALPDFL